MQGRGYGQGTTQDASTRLDQATDQLVQELRLSNRDMRVIRLSRGHREDQPGTFGVSLERLARWRRRNRLAGRVSAPDGLLFLVFTAPERDVQRYDSAFHEMLRSVRIKR